MAGTRRSRGRLPRAQPDPNASLVTTRHPDDEHHSVSLSALARLRLRAPNGGEHRRIASRGWTTRRRSGRVRDASSRAPPVGEFAGVRTGSRRVDAVEALAATKKSLSSQTVITVISRRCCPRRAFPFRSRSCQVVEGMLKNASPRGHGGFTMGGHARPERSRTIAHWQDQPRNHHRSTSRSTRTIRARRTSVPLGKSLCPRSRTSPFYREVARPSNISSGRAH